MSFVKPDEDIPILSSNLSITDVYIIARRNHHLQDKQARTSSLLPFLASVSISDSVIIFVYILKRQWLCHQANAISNITTQWLYRH